MVTYFRGFLLFLFIFRMQGICAPINLSEWPYHTIKFGERGYLGDVLQSGIELFYYPGRENRTIAFRRCHVRIQVGTLPPTPYFEVHFGEMEVYHDYLISIMTFQGPTMNLAAGRQALQPWVAHAKHPVDFGPFDVLAEKMRVLGGYKPDDFRELALFSFQLKMPPIAGFKPIPMQGVIAPKQGISLLYSFDHTKPCDIRYGIGWGDIVHRKEINYFTGPIQPPPGFEHIDLATPANWHLRDKDDYPSMATQPAQSVLKPPARTPVPTGYPEVASSTWWKWLLVIVVTLLLGRQLLLKRRSKDREAKPRGRE